MPRIIGIFEDRSAVDGVVEQLELNNVAGTTIITPTGTEGSAEENTRSDRQVQSLRLPKQQHAEYLARLQRGQYLLLIEVSALDLPMVQRALRSGSAVDIDLLPESGT